jgi:hypothetical protein
MHVLALILALINKTTIGCEGLETKKAIGYLSRELWFYWFIPSRVPTLLWRECIDFRLRAGKRKEAENYSVFAVRCFYAIKGIRVWSRQVDHCSGDSKWLFWRHETPRTIVVVLLSHLSVGARLRAGLCDAMQLLVQYLFNLFDDLFDGKQYRREMQAAFCYYHHHTCQYKFYAVT